MLLMALEAARPGVITRTESLDSYGEEDDVGFSGYLRMDNHLPQLNPDHAPSMTEGFGAQKKKDWLTPKSFPNRCARRLQGATLAVSRWRIVGRCVEEEV
jgi:hypothetical protein